MLYPANHPLQMRSCTPLLMYPHPCPNLLLLRIPHHNLYPNLSGSEREPYPRSVAGRTTGSVCPIGAHLQKTKFLATTLFPATPCWVAPNITMTRCEEGVKTLGQKVTNNNNFSVLWHQSWRA